MSVLTDARSYVNSRLGPTYSAWMALSDDDAGRSLVSATDMIDSFQWQGVASGVVGSLPTSLQWPRSGVFVDGVELDPAVVPPQVVKACFELAVMINDDPSLPFNVDAGSNVQSMGASGASLSFFRPTSAAEGTAPRLPPLIDRLIGRFLASSVAVSTGFISGTNAQSNFETPPGTCAEQRRDVRWPV